MKKFLTLALAASMALSMTACGTKTEPVQTAEETPALQELSSIVESGVLKVGYTLINPLNYFDEQSGELVGFETEFAQAVCEKLGVKAEFYEIDWDSKEIELNSKSIDCIWNGMTITPDRAENMSISAPYMENRQVLVVKAGAEDKYTAFDGVKVVAEAGSAGEELAQGEESFANAEFTPVQSQATALMEVASGTADVAIIDYVMAGSSVGEGRGYADLAIIDKGYESEEYGIAFRKGSDVTEAVNEAILTLVADGKLAEIAAKYGLEDLILF